VINEFDEIIKTYERVVLNIELQAKESQQRAFGGVIRGEKGKLVERLGKQLIEIAWHRLPIKEREKFDFDIIGCEFNIPMKRNYIDKIKNKEVKRYIEKNFKRYYYSYKPDVVVFLNQQPVLAVECKAYTENAMFKRILVDCSLLKMLYPRIKVALLQLESQLGGDYSSLNDLTYGSPSTHTLLSYFDIDLHIITLLKGERKVREPIHQTDFFKPLTELSLQRATTEFEQIFYEILS